LGESPTFLTASTHLVFLVEIDSAAVGLADLVVAHDAFLYYFPMWTNAVDCPAVPGTAARVGGLSLVSKEFFRIIRMLVRAGRELPDRA